MKWLVFGILTIFLFKIFANAVHIDDKLDFEEKPNHPLEFRTIPVKTAKVIASSRNPADDFDTIGVVCVSGGCNKTSTSTTSEDSSVKTDVIVHIETKVNLKNNDNKTQDFVDDTPDIPVVIGYSGAKLDSTVEDQIGDLVSPKQIYVPSSEESRSIYMPGLNSNFRKSYSLQPIGHRGNGASFQPSSLHTSSGVSYYPTSNSYTPPVFTPVGSRIDISRDNTIDNLKSLYYDSGTADPQQAKVHINFKTLTPMAVSITDNNRNNIDIKYRSNNDSHISVPYFEQSYHNHYYGENPPPQNMWYPRNNNGFKMEIPNYSSVVFQRKNSFEKNTNTVGTLMNCPCQNGQTSGLSWYPMKKSFNDPGSQINDKLAPLN